MKCASVFDQILRDCSFTEDEEKQGKQTWCVKLPTPYVVFAFCKFVRLAAIFWQFTVISVAWPCLVPRAFRVRFTGWKSAILKNTKKTLGIKLVYQDGGQNTVYTSVSQNNLVKIFQSSSLKDIKTWHFLKLREKWHLANQCVNSKYCNRKKIQSSYRSRNAKITLDVDISIMLKTSL